jgi:hypothetical protein
MNSPSSRRGSESGKAPSDKASRAIKAKVSLAIRFEHNKDDFGAVIVEAGGAQPAAAISCR